MSDATKPSRLIVGSAEWGEKVRHLMSTPRWRRRQLLRNTGHLVSPLIYRYQDFVPTNKLSMDKAEDLLVKAELYLPTPSSFNDPYEFQARLELDSNPVKRRAYLKSAGKAAGCKGKKLEARVADLMRAFNTNAHAMDELVLRARDCWGVACFSLDPRSLRMWSHYAAKHSGICLQFDVAEDIEFAVQTFKVNYQPNIATLKWPAESNRVLDDLILRKWDVWAEESEVRFATQEMVNWTDQSFIDTHRPLCA